MRNHLARSTGLAVLAAVLAVTGACDGGPGEAKEPPVLTVTSPARGTVQGHAGQVTVTGTALSGPQGDPVDKVVVNDVAATLAADGSFTAVITVNEGATLIETVAHGANGTTVSDTRAIQAGQLRPVGSNIEKAIDMSMSADSFARLSTAAGPILKGTDMASLLAPMQPMLNVGGGSTYAQLFVDNVKFSDVHVAMAPVQGGLSFRAELDQLDVPAHVRFAVLGLGGTESLRVTADRVVVAGTLTVTPAGLSGFKTKIASPNVSVTNFHFEAGGIPRTILDLLHIDSIVQSILPPAAELAMTPLVNQALGALGGPQQLDVLGKKLDLQLAPSTIAFDPSGAVLGMNLRVMLEGSQSSPGFVFTSNGAPAMDASYGFQLGLADDLLNEMFAELHAIGALDLTVPKDVGLFDAVQIHMTMPPMISADARDGELRIVLGDMAATYTKQGTPVGKAAINARIDLQIVPVGNGNSIALKLGTPELHVDPLDDVINTTGVDGRDLSAATAASVGAQIDAISKLLVAIPLPAIAGLSFHNLAIGSDQGYVMVSGQLQ